MLFCVSISATLTAYPLKTTKCSGMGRKLATIRIFLWQKIFFIVFEISTKNFCDAFRCAAKSALSRRFDVIFIICLFNYYIYYIILFRRHPDKFRRRKPLRIAPKPLLFADF